MNLSIIGRLATGAFSSLILVISIVTGSLLGYSSPATGEWLSNHVDFTLLALVGLLFFGLRFDGLSQVSTSLRFISITLMANFVVVPLIGYGLASLFLSTNPLLMVGLVIYFMAPCTDWFLSFTRLSGGNVVLGAALIPINIILQLLLYPLYLQWFTQNGVQVEAAVIAGTVLQWFLLPLMVAVAAHRILRWMLNPAWFERVLEFADTVTLWLTALLVLQIFAGNILVTLDHLSVLVWVLIAVISYFIVAFLLSEGLSYLFHLHYPEHVLLTMTISARNAPLMLAVTMAVLPDQPLIYAALVIGMLVEIPHLTALRHFLLSKRRRILRLEKERLPI